MVKPRWRTLALLILLGLPLLAAVALARVTTSALWFQEVGQGVYARIVAARLRLAVGAGGLTAGFLLANAGIVVAHTRARNRHHFMFAAVAASAIVGARAERHWQLLVLWLHSRHSSARQPRNSGADPALGMVAVLKHARLSGRARVCVYLFPVRDQG